MDLLIEAEIIVKLAPEIVSVHLQMQRLDPGDLRVGDPQAGQASGNEIQAGDHLEQVADVGLGELAHPRPPIGQQFDEPFGGEHFERLAERRAGDVERFA
jgi:hypothetical protein